MLQKSSNRGADVPAWRGLQGRESLGSSSGGTYS